MVAMMPSWGMTTTTFTVAGLAVASPPVVTVGNGTATTTATELGVSETDAEEKGHHESFLVLVPHAQGDDDEDKRKCAWQNYH